MTKWRKILIHPEERLWVCVVGERDDDNNVERKWGYKQVTSTKQLLRSMIWDRNLRRKKKGEINNFESFLSPCVKLLFALDSRARDAHFFHRLSNGRAAKAKEEVDILFCFLREGERPDVLRWKKSHRLSIFFFPVASHIFFIVIKLIFRTHEKGDDDMRTRIGELLFWNLIIFFSFLIWFSFIITSHKDDAARTYFRFF